MKASKDVTMHERTINVENGIVIQESFKRYSFVVKMVKIQWVEGKPQRSAFVLGTRILKNGELGNSTGHASFALDGDTRWNPPAPEWLLELIEARA